MNKATAVQVKGEALRAIEALSSALKAAQGCDDDEMTLLHKEVGIIIGRIQMGILEPIVAQYPDLDDLQ